MSARDSGFGVWGLGFPRTPRFWVSGLGRLAASVRQGFQSCEHSTLSGSDPPKTQWDPHQEHLVRRADG